MKHDREVCITTWYGTENYGSNLQAIGLAKTINCIGYNVFFLRRFSVKSFFIFHPRLLYTKIINKINKKKSVSFFSAEDYSISKDRIKRLEVFRNEYFKEKQFISQEDWKKAKQADMIFVCGSDIIWNPARGYPDFRFLDFAYYAKLDRFSYASSVGAKRMPKSYHKAYKKYLGSMVAVGVREQSVADMLEPIIGRKVIQVIDPTLLLSKEEWEQFADNAEVSVDIDRNGYVLCYFVMNDMRYWNYVAKIYEETGLQVIVLPMHNQDEDQPYDIILDGTPYEFVWLVKNAEIVCTDSFHACVMSMIFEKEFYLLRRKRKAEDDKYDDFLVRYGLTERSVNDESDFIRKKVKYQIAKERLKEDRERSMQFLSDALEACDGKLL